MQTARRWAALAVCSLVVTSCSFVFADHHVAPADPSGCWCGEWCSHCNGHHGPIRARICQQDSCTYCAHFSGRFLGFVPFAYKVPLTVTGVSEGRTHLTGQSHLPIFGDFCCNVEVTACDFVASYNATKDQGQFTMQRQ